MEYPSWISRPQAKALLHLGNGMSVWIGGAEVDGEFSIHDGEYAAKYLAESIPGMNETLVRRLAD